ncbi:RHOMBOID-like protein [Drosera capensis]
MTPYYKIPCKTQAQNLLVLYNPRGITCESHSIHEGSNGANAKFYGYIGRWKVQRAMSREKKGHCCNSIVSPRSTIQERYLFPVWCALESKSSLNHRRSLESYLGKLQNGTKSLTVDTLDDKEIGGGNSLEKARLELSLLDKYLAALSQDNLRSNMAATPMIDSSGENDSIMRKNKDDMGRPKIIAIREMKIRNRLKEPSVPSLCNESFDLYLISFLASINIAVYLFELASPIKNVDYNIYSLPAMFGAKINHLILVGEWWRLVTPMFLHSGLLHVSLGCWALLSFAPQVSKAYGPFTIFLIYILGGVAGNLTSFLHTPETTVGGSGPVFAIIGAWFSYQMLNKGLIAKETSEEMLRKAVVVTTLSCVLSSFGPIDNWGDFGAAFTGISFGFLTCLMLQVNNASSKVVQEEGIALASRRANPFKSLMIFSFFLLVLGSLLFVTEPPLGTMELEVLF